MPHRLTALAVFVAVASSVSMLAPVSVVFASDAEGSASAQEEALIKHGLELREKHDDEGALAEFQRAYQLSKGGRALAQIALAEQALGRWVDARDSPDASAPAHATIGGSAGTKSCCGSRWPASRGTPARWRSPERLPAPRS